MEELTAARKRSIRMLGMLEGLRLAREKILDADHMTSKAAESCRRIIDHEISKIMTLPEHHFE